MKGGNTSIQVGANSSELLGGPTRGGKNRGVAVTAVQKRVATAILVIIGLFIGPFVAPVLSATQQEEDQICQIWITWEADGNPWLHVRGISPPSDAIIRGHASFDDGAIVESDILNRPTIVPPGQEVFGANHGTEWPLVGRHSGEVVHYFLWLVDLDGIPISGPAGIHPCPDTVIP